jgi:hypothetical protein
MHRNRGARSAFTTKVTLGNFGLSVRTRLAWECDRYAGGLLNRTPRPPLELVALSEMSSIPLASSAATSFISESTLPRMTPSLASIRWIVGNERSDNFASLRWSMSSIARAARSCAAVIMFYVSVVTTKPLVFEFMT